MSELWEVFYEIGYIFWLLVPGILITLVLVALACYGFQMIRLFFKF